MRGRAGDAARCRASGLAWLLALAAGVACGGSDLSPELSEAPLVAVEVPAAATPRAVARIEVRGLGTIRVELLADVAPRTAAHFAKLAEEGYYDGTTFHRVIPGFMVQGGDPNTRDGDPRNDGLGGPDYTVPDEFSKISHLRGIVSMANRGGRDTAGSQFFVVLEPTRPLDGRYTVFGQVIEGMEVVDEIAAVERDVYARYGPRDRPREDVVIESLRVERAAEDATTAAAVARHPADG